MLGLESLLKERKNGPEREGRARKRKLHLDVALMPRIWSLGHFASLSSKFTLLVTEARFGTYLGLPGDASQSSAAELSLSWRFWKRARWAESRERRQTRASWTQVYGSSKDSKMTSTSSSGRESEKSRWRGAARASERERESPKRPFLADGIARRPNAG